MALDNLVHVEFTDAELDEINQHLTKLESILKSKAIQLSTTENKRYGRLGEGNENWVNTIFLDTETAPEMIPPFVDRTEWAAHEKVRDQLLTINSRLDALALEVVETNRMVGYNIYKKCQLIYENARMLSSKNFKGFKVHYEKWSAFFTKNNQTPTPKDTNVNG
jgi:hypothetical protein